MTEKLRPFLNLRAAIEQIGYAVSASEEYSRTAANDRVTGASRRRKLPGALDLPL